MDDRPRYMISVAAELVGMHPQTLRIYESKGLLRPKRTAGNTRLYSEADLDRLRLIQRLTNELGLNLAGVEQVIRLQDELERCAGSSIGWSGRCEPRSARCTVSTGATSSPGSRRSRSSGRPADGLQQADDQEPGGRRARRRSSRAAWATPSSIPSTSSWRCSTRSCRSSSCRMRPSCAHRRRPPCAPGRRCRAWRSSPTYQPPSRACSTRPRTRRSGWRTTTSPRSTFCWRSTSSSATGSRRRSRRCAAASA